MRYFFPRACVAVLSLFAETAKGPKSGKHTVVGTFSDYAHKPRSAILFLGERDCGYFGCRVPLRYIYTVDPLHHRSTYHFINPRESIAMTAPSSTEVKKRKRRMGQTGQREQGEQGVKEGQRKRERVRRHTLLLLNLVNHASTRRGFDESQKHPQPCGDRRGGGAPSFILS